MLHFMFMLLYHPFFLDTCLLCVPASPCVPVLIMTSATPPLVFLQYYHCLLLSALYPCAFTFLVFQLSPNVSTYLLMDLSPRPPLLLKYVCTSSCFHVTSHEYYHISLPQFPMSCSKCTKNVQPLKKTIFVVMGTKSSKIDVNKMYTRRELQSAAAPAINTKFQRLLDFNLRSLLNETCNRHAYYIL